MSPCWGLPCGIMINAVHACGGQTLHIQGICSTFTTAGWCPAGATTTMMSLTRNVGAVYGDISASRRATASSDCTIKRSSLITNPSCAAAYRARQPWYDLLRNRVDIGKLMASRNIEAQVSTLVLQQLGCSCRLKPTTGTNQGTLLLACRSSRPTQEQR